MLVNMTAQNEKQQSILDNVKRCLNKSSFYYHEYDDHMLIKVKSKSIAEELDYILIFREPHKQFMITCPLPEQIPESIHRDILPALNVIQLRMSQGTVDYYNSGTVEISMAVPYDLFACDTEDGFGYMFATVHNAVEAFAPLIIDTVRGRLTPEQLLRAVTSSNGSDIERKRRYTFTIPTKEYEDLCYRIYKESPQDYTVIGYRTGRAPLPTLIRVFGYEHFLEKAVRMYLSDLLPKLDDGTLDDVEYRVMHVDEHGYASFMIIL